MRLLGPSLLDLVPMAPVAPVDGETRPETLLPGDLLRWLGVWHLVHNVRVRMLDGVTFLDLHDPVADVRRLVFYRPGCWVAAMPAPRQDDVA